MTTRFDFRFAPAYARAARIFGITPERAFVEVDEETFSARYGPWRVRTPLENVCAVAVTGPYRFWKTAGPCRLALTDSGLTFASNSERGVLVSFTRKVPCVDFFGLRPHCEVTVTVADTEGLARLLQGVIDGRAH